MEREIELMSGLHHPRIIQLYDAYDDGSTIVCVLELYVTVQCWNGVFYRNKYESIGLFWLESKAVNYLNV